MDSIHYMVVASLYRRFGFFWVKECFQLMVAFLQFSQLGLFIVIRLAQGFFVTQGLKQCYLPLLDPPLFKGNRPIDIDVLTRFT